MYRLIWEYKGAIRGQVFNDWKELESFSKRLINAGLSPWVPMDSPTPYDDINAAIIKRR